MNYRFLEELRQAGARRGGHREIGLDSNYLRFGLGLSSDFRGDAYFNLLASYRRTWINP